MLLIELPSALYITGHWCPMRDLFQLTDNGDPLTQSGNINIVLRTLCNDK